MDISWNPLLKDSLDAAVSLMTASIADDEEVMGEILGDATRVELMMIIAGLTGLAGSSLKLLHEEGYKAPVEMLQTLALDMHLDDTYG